MKIWQFLWTLPLLDHHKINVGTNLKNFDARDLDLRVKMCFAPQKVFLGGTNFAAACLKIPLKITAMLIE